MQSSLIGKVEKAKRYADERHRVTFLNFTLKFSGEHSSYLVNYREGAWHCSCAFFSKWNTCSHTMAMQRILGEMLGEKENSGADNTLS
jgi:hypothetical protein